MEIDCSGKDIGKERGKGKAKEEKNNGQSQSKRAEPDKQKSAACAKRSHFARDCWSRTHQDKTVNELEGAKVNADAAKRVCVHD